MRKLSIVLGFIAATFAATSFALWRELRLEQQHADSLRTTLAQLQAATRTPPPLRDIPVTRNSVQSLSESLPLPASPEPALELAQDVTSTEGGPEARKRGAPTNAKYQDARRELRRLELANRHRDLAKALGLSPQTADKLLDLLADTEMDPRGARRDNPAEADARTSAQQSAVKELLGKSKYAEWENYQASMPSRFQVNQLRSTAAAGADPLREDQVEPLIAAMHVEQQRFRDEMEEYRATVTASAGDEQQAREQENARLIAGLNATSQRIHAAAAPILSTQQLKTLDEQLQRQIQMREARNRVNRARNQPSPPERD